MLNYYRQCLKGAANDQAILNSYLKDTRKEDKRTIMWSQEVKNAFETCKTALANAASLAYPAETVPLILITDASNVAVGASLEQHVNGEVKPIAFFSKKFTEAQKRYSAYDREGSMQLSSISDISSKADKSSYSLITNR